MRGLASGVVVAACIFALAGSASASTGVFAWGENEVGQLGNGTTFNSDTPVPISGLTGVTDLAGGERHSLALLSNGTVMTWGENGWGQLGDGTHTGPESCHAAYAGASGYTVACSTTPIPVSGLSGVVAIAAAAHDSYALLSDGTVMAWGDNESGQLGDGSSGPEHCYKETEPTQCSTTPVPVGGLSEVTAIAAGENYALALLADGTVMAWGSDGYGELGDGGTAWGDDVPAAVTGLTGVTAIAAGGHGSLALLNNGTVMAWGGNDFGQLGDGTLTQSDVPVAVSGLGGISAVARGGETSFAIRNDGTAVAWGSNTSGQLGYGTMEGPFECFPLNFCSPTPVEVNRIEQAKTIAAGAGQSLALLSDGDVMAWGLNWEGQLGNASTEISDLPVDVSGLSHVTAIAAGEQFSLAYSATPEPPPPVTGVAPNNDPSSAGSSVSSTESDPPAAGTKLPLTMPGEVSKPKSLTRAEKLANALKACKRKPKDKWAACEKQVRKKFASPKKQSARDPSAARVSAESGSPRPA
jgi:alpha-tubulin suppressor-like RCC1 family protein